MRVEENGDKLRLSPAPGCDIPNEIQFAAANGGLFGPDAQIPWGSRPGYRPAPSLMNTNMPRPWVDFNPLMDFGIPGTIGPARMPSVEDLIGPGGASPSVSGTGISSAMGSGDYYAMRGALNSFMSAYNAPDPAETGGGYIPGAPHIQSSLKADSGCGGFRYM